VTTNGRQRFDPVPRVDAEYSTGAPVDALWSQHRSRLERARGGWTRWSDADVAAVLVALENEAIDAGVARGTHVPMTPEEVAAMRLRHGG
jgi:hypothetical protein